MAKKNNKSTSKSLASKSALKKATSVVSRNSPVPRPSPVKREITHEMIAKRAYEIYVSGKGGSQLDNWLRAERELRGS
jgi:Protein of unknown function (DUF2934)